MRVGYYSRHDGLDVIWLVNANGEYMETIDHDALKRHFRVVKRSKETALFGVGRRRLPRLSSRS